MSLFIQNKFNLSDSHFIPATFSCKDYALGISSGIWLKVPSDYFLNHGFTALYDSFTHLGQAIWKIEKVRDDKGKLGFSDWGFKFVSCSFVVTAQPTLFKP